MRRPRHLRIVASSAFACALIALCLAGIAGADTTTVLTDPAGDAGSGVDITRLEIEKYDEGGATFWVTVNGFFACSSDGDGEPAMVALDLDQNPDTGSAFYGTEVAFAPAGPVGDAHLLRADGWDFRGARNQLGLGGGCGPGRGIYSIDLSKLGLKPNAGFNVVVAAVGSGAPLTFGAVSGISTRNKPLVHPWALPRFPSSSTARTPFPLASATCVQTPSLFSTFSAL